MLSNHSISASPANNPLQAQMPHQQQQFGSADQAGPGAKGGSVPSMNSPAPNQSNPASPDTNPLAQYAIKNDTTSTGAATAQPAAQQAPQMPSADDFNKLATQISSSIAPPNQELVTKALSGGADAGQALMQLLSAQQSELMSKTMHATFLANNKMADRNRESTTKQIRTDLENTSYVDTAVKAAISNAPDLGTGIKAALLNTAIAELRKQYPTAPAQLIGAEAAKQLATTQSPTDNDQMGLPATNMNWLEELG